jgi:hypothetical protein
VDYPAYKVSEIGWRRPRPDNRDIGSVSKVVGNPPPGIISGLLVIRPLTANVHISPDRFLILQSLN